VKAIKACIEKLLSEWIFASNIVIMTPPVIFAMWENRLCLSSCGSWSAWFNLR